MFMKWLVFKLSSFEICVKPHEFKPLKQFSLYNHKLISDHGRLHRSSTVLLARNLSGLINKAFSVSTVSTGNIESVTLGLRCTMQEFAKQPRVSGTVRSANILMLTAPWRILPSWPTSRGNIFRGFSHGPSSAATTANHTGKQSWLLIWGKRQHQKQTAQWYYWLAVHSAPERSLVQAFSASFPGMHDQNRTGKVLSLLPSPPAVRQITLNFEHALWTVFWQLLPPPLFWTWRIHSWRLGYLHYAASSLLVWLHAGH